MTSNVARREELDLQKTGAAQSEQIACTVPSGPAAAAVLAAGIGSAVYGLTVLIATASPAVSKCLTLSSGVGPLSGKTSVGVAAWVLAQIVLCLLWRKREVNFTRVWIVSALLITAGFVLTFPPVYDLVAPH